VKIRNTSAVPLRAAYLHGPYTIYVACYPATFDPNHKHERAAEEGVPEFEPNLKAGGHWTTKLSVPKEIRDAVGSAPSRSSLDGEPRSFTWIIEVQSQVIFSTTAAVHFEVLAGRDEKSVDLGFHGVVGSGHGAPGRLEDHQQGRSRNAAQSKGVFSKAVRLAVDDTESLWNTPPFPTWDEDGNVATHEGPHHGDKVDTKGKESRTEKQTEDSTAATKVETPSTHRTKFDGRPKKQKKVHLVVLCHGIHSNLGADMLYLKESIDTAAKQAREDQKKRRAELRKNDAEQQNDFGRQVSGERSKSVPEIAVQMDEDEDEDDEQVLVRGFNGNAVKTEKGIQYLGKRLAKYVLSITYPDQPYLPVKSSISKSITRTLTGQKSKDDDKDGGQPIHKNSSIVKDTKHQNHNLAYKITSISFISHSLGGLVQTYAIAYIQKHSPEFFDLIKPINFVAMASPFLGLSNENPMYVRFALDFGLVGRTGQDLGLTWRAPTMVRSGWGAMIGGLGEQKKHAQPDPGSKPLLRILPTGPAHVALKKFRNRSVYSNVVNDGIVPLRTSCLLFLDWRGLGRVERARRENGVIGTMVGWGWAEMTGQNASEAKKPFWNDIFGDSGDEAGKSGRKTSREHDHGDDVPQAEAGESLDTDVTQNPDKAQFLSRSGTQDVTVKKPFQDEAYEQNKAAAKATEQPGLFSGFMNLFKPQPSAEAHHHAPKKVRPYVRGQTMREFMGSREDSVSTDGSSSPEEGRPGPVRGSSLYTNNSAGGEDLQAPPRTTFFESAGDLLAPPLPPREFLIDPAARPRTIFHDRVYHPEDIPAPPVKRQRTSSKRMGSRDGADKLGQESINSNTSGQVDDGGGMKIEEKIARAYHKDLSWRKVLVRLEPDAHNNMVVRRMFSNAYGWPVIKHLCDTHFAYTAAAMMSDAEEKNEERAKPMNVAAGKEGEEVTGQADLPDEEGREHLRRNSVDTADADNTVVHGAKTLSEDVRRLNINVEPPSPPMKRAHSENRESRDEITELVSPVSPITATAFGDVSYSSLNSARGSLRQITRSDSARWSDRFFEGSDDSSDDEEYITALRKAQARGEELNKKEIDRAARTGTNESKKSTKSLGESLIIDNKITQSPNQSTVDLVAGDPTEHFPTQTTREDYVTASERKLPTTSDLGLGKSIDEQISSAIGSRSDSAGVAESVAKAGAMTEAKDEESLGN
jgi:hypothetical protein